jgi:hypothetical protein
MWHDLDPYWEELWEVAGSHDSPKPVTGVYIGRKQGKPPTREQSRLAHFYGLLGEKVYSLETGLPMYTRYEKNGDSGIDFPDGTNVKTSTYYFDPWLKVSPSELGVARRYVLVGLDVDMRRAGICGIATSIQVRAAPLRDWGNGPMHSLRWYSIRLRTDQ